MQLMKSALHSAYLIVYCIEFLIELLTIPITRLFMMNSTDLHKYDTWEKLCTLMSDPKGNFNIVSD